MPCVAGQSTAEIVSLLREMFMIGKTEEQVMSRPFPSQDDGSPRLERRDKC